jgi:hypothetical protein
MPASPKKSRKWAGNAVARGAGKEPRSGPKRARSEAENVSSMLVAWIAQHRFCACILMQIHKSQRNGSCALGCGRAWLWSALNSARSDQIIRCGLCTDVRCWSRFLGPDCLLSPLGRQPPRATRAPRDLSMGKPHRARRGALRARGGPIAEKFRRKGTE